MKSKKDNETYLVSFKKFTVKFLLYILSPAISCGILILVFFLKDVYPFGYSNVIHTDMLHSYVPLYYHLWDVIHSGKSLFYDIYSAGGINMAGSVSFIGLLSPLNIVFFFINRDIIPEFMSIFTAMKIILTSISSSIFFNSQFKKNGILNVCLSLIYTFCGFVLIYQSNIMWLDIVFLFPFFVMSFLRMIKGNGNIAYIFMLFLCLVVNAYLTFMILLFIILFSGTYLLIYRRSEEYKGRYILRLGICTLIGIMLSMFVILPGIIHMTGGVRAEAGRNIIDILYKLNFHSHQKWGMLISSGFCVAVIVFVYITREKYIRDAMFWFALIFFLGSQLIFENINAIWHFGEYYSFPLRYSYMLIFVIACMVSFFLEKDRSFPGLQKPVPFRGIIISAAFGCLGLYIYLYLRYGTGLKFNIIGDTNPEILNIFVIMFISMLIYYYLILYCFGMWKGRYFIFVGVVAEIFIYSMVFIGLPTALNFDINASDVVVPINNIKAVGNSYGDKDIYERGKWIFSPNVNYGFMTKIPSLSNWTHMISRDKKESVIDIGYSSHNTVIYENGGTAFSDALFGVKNVFSISGQMDDQLYTETYKVRDVNVYDAVYQMPFGVIMDKYTAKDSTDSIFSPEIYNPFIVQNDVYRKITGSDDGIIGYLDADVSFVNLEKVENITSNDYNKIDKETDSWIDAELKVTGKKAVYFFLNYERSEAVKVDNKYFSANQNSMEIYVNGEYLRNKPAERFYPSVENNGLVLLGCFEDETVKVSIKVMRNLKFNEIVFGDLDLKKLDDLCSKLEENNICSNIVSKSEGIFSPAKIDFDITLPADILEGKKSLFIPISYDKGFRCFINGREINVDKAVGGFMSLPLSGISPLETNSVSLVFLPEGMSFGLKVSIFSGVLMLLYIIFFVVMKIRLNVKWMEKLCLRTFFAIYYTVLVAVYFIPIIFTILSIPYRIVMHYLGG